MLAARGILDGLKSKANQVEKTAEEYKDKAKGTISQYNMICACPDLTIPDCVMWF